jgi:hypothetical protein
MIVNLGHGEKIATEGEQHLEIGLAFEMMIETKIGLAMGTEMATEIEAVVLDYVAITEILIGIEMTRRAVKPDHCKAQTQNVSIYIINIYVM